MTLNQNGVAESPASTRPMPVLFVGHGSPMNAIETIWPKSSLPFATRACSSSGAATWSTTFAASCSQTNASVT